MEHKKAKLTFGDMVQYSSGAIGYQATFSLMSVYLMSFFTDVFGITAIAVSGIMFTSKIVDAVTDPMMGMIADHTRTRFGRYRPWLIFGSPLLAIVVFLLFYTPDCSPIMKVVYAYILYSAYSVASTIVNMPFHTLASVITRDPQQRMVVVSWKNGMCQVGNFLVTTFAIPIVIFLGDGERGWAGLGAVVGIFAMFTFWVSAHGTKKYDIVEEKQKKQKVHISTEMKAVLKNKPLLLLMGSFGSIMIGTTVFSSINVYYFKYVLNRVDLLPVAMTLQSIGAIIAILSMPFFTKRVDKKVLYRTGCFCSMILAFIIMLKPTMSVVGILGIIAVFGFTSNVVQAMAWTMIMDCIDYAEYKFRLKANGLVLSSFTFMNKCGSALGVFFGSFVLGLVGFVANQAQTQSTLNTIVLLSFGLPAAIYLISVILMHFYGLTNTKCAQMKEELDNK